MRSDVVKKARRALKGQPLYLITGSGSGRIPIIERDGKSYIRAAYEESVHGRKQLCTDDQVWLPEDIKPIPGISFHDRWRPYLAVSTEDIDNAIKRLLASTGSRRARSGHFAL